MVGGVEGRKSREGSAELGPWELVPHRRGRSLCGRQGLCLEQYQIHRESSWARETLGWAKHGGQLAGASCRSVSRCFDGAKPGSLQKSAGAPHACATPALQLPLKHRSAPWLGIQGPTLRFSSSAPQSRSLSGLLLPLNCPAMSRSESEFPVPQRPNRISKQNWAWDSFYLGRGLLSQSISLHS